MADKGFFENIREGDLGGLARNIAEGARDEWLGIDDFTRFAKYMGEGKFLKAAKSLGAGVFELGGSVAMVLPGGQIVGVPAKMIKGGKIAKGAKVAQTAGKGTGLVRNLRGLTLAEQAAQRAALKTGGKRSLLRGIETSGLKGYGTAVERELIGEAGRFGRKYGIQPTRKTSGAQSVKNIAQRVSDYRLGRLPVGGSRGGIVGSTVRGIGGITGMTPAPQGPLARRAFAQRLAGKPVTAGARLGEMASGKVGMGLTRTGIDTELTAPLMRAPEPAAVNRFGLSESQMQELMLTLSPEELTQVLRYLESQQGGMV